MNTPPSLSRQQVLAFARDGYLVIPDLVAAALVAAARGEIDAQLDGENAAPPGHLPPMEANRTIHALIQRTGIVDLAEGLIGHDAVEVSPDAQVALNFPGHNHIPGGGHLDGWNPPQTRWTFTMLVGILLSDQESPNMGNLWLWPGTHITHGAFFREHGADSMLTIPHNSPPIQLPEATQFLGRAGDVILAHYLLAHNIGGNMSDRLRYAAYFRIRRTGHDDRWREAMENEWLEWDGVRAALEGQA